MSEMTLEQAMSMVDGGPHHIGEWAQAATILAAEVRRLQALAYPPQDGSEFAKIAYKDQYEAVLALASENDQEPVLYYQDEPYLRQSFLRKRIDAAIAAERERIAAFCEANPTKYGDQLAEMIRARGNA